MSRYNVSPDLMEQVAHGFQALETTSGSSNEETKEDTTEFLREYRESIL